MISYCYDFEHRERDNIVKCAYFSLNICDLMSAGKRTRVILR